MTIDDSIYEELIATTGITALVGARIYRGWRPQESKTPCISFFRVSTTPLNGATGASGTDNARIQIDCWATSPKSARAIAEAVRGALDGWISVSPASHAALLVADVDLVEPPQEAAGQFEYRVSQDYSIWMDAS
jgi:hypothetical protein